MTDPKVTMSGTRTVACFSWEIPSLEMRSKKMLSLSCRFFIDTRTTALGDIRRSDTIVRTRAGIVSQLYVQSEITIRSKRLCCIIKSGNEVSSQSSVALSSLLPRASVLDMALCMFISRSVIASGRSVKRQTQLMAEARNMPTIPHPVPSSSTRKPWERSRNDAQDCTLLRALALA